jgi:hypothetical protein
MFVVGFGPFSLPAYWPFRNGNPASQCLGNFPTDLKVEASRDRMACNEIERRNGG